MKHKVSELEGVLLDAAVAIAEGHPLSCDWNQGDYILIGTGAGDLERFEPSSDWADGGPIIERERISVGPGLACWYANIGGRGDDYAGPTPLIAAMRAFVRAKLGDEVELP